MGKKIVTSKKELDELYDSISEDKKTMATIVYNELVFMLDTLEKLRDEINTRGATDHFINGKQDFIRENPALTSYNKVMKTYNMFYKNFINLLSEQYNFDDDFDNDDLL